MRRLSGVLNYDDTRAAARRTLPRSIFEYVDAGSEDELTLGWNRDAYRDLAFAPRGATWVPEPELGRTILGVPSSMPILTAPCGGMRLLHPEGDLAITRAAAAAGIIPVVTSASGYSLEQIADEPGTKFFQAYRFSDENAMKTLVGRANKAGYHALVATIDTAVGGNRERDFRNGFSYNMRIDLANITRMAPKVMTRPGWVYRFMRDGMPFELPNTADITPDRQPMELSALTRSGKSSHSPDWDDIAWMRANWDGPLVVKGVLTVADARRAQSLGADGIIVSNHGGRQLDGAPASLRALGPIVDVVGDTMEVLVDGGIRRGADIAKALSVGARAVLVGRYTAFGLAAAGEAGVAHVLEHLRSQLFRTMQLMGCADIEDLDGSWVQQATTSSLGLSRR
ncbi:alpha-hydroxy acid oxidase [Rhodococcus sp. H36-A4]|uniref:alpha-hydroxy acid oxidase n=1 Tax=Rhodococcus sp. H36-A4 TaxID=3004353 RepID=UPI0022AFFB18|nr:alpha-hydroxy acid oxidase [Rhodococcus sp. H36-A4]MCZ4080467.1 alpha-hydroxy acid oxidase [Rhodococcus sp. H36-A4]